MSKTETLGRRLRRLREERGLSQRTLCVDTRYTAAYVSRIEADARQPSVTAIRAFAERLNVDALYLETGEDVVVVQATQTEIDEAAGRFRASLRWADLTPEERRQVTHGLQASLIDSLAARMHAAGLMRGLAARD